MEGTVEDALLYNESFEDWKKRTGGTRTEWSRLCAALWAKIKDRDRNVVKTETKGV